MSAAPRSRSGLILRFSLSARTAGLVLTACLAAALLPGNLPAAHAAASIAVNTNADDITVNGNCTLREALSAIATAATVDGCTYTTGADTIAFAGNYIITLNSGLGPLVIDNETVTIAGGGQANTIIQGNYVRGVVSYRLFSVSGGAHVTLNDLTVRNGGGIYVVSSWLILSNVTVADNATTDAIGGGGIGGGDALVSLDHSTVRGNTALGSGGGISGNYGSRVSITSSTISGNYATQRGGGVFFYDNGSGYPMTISASTISGNSTGGSGGGLLAEGPVVITGSRLLNNTADGTGGAIWDAGVPGATMTVHGSCIVGNSPVAAFNLNGELQDYTGNWWGSTSGPGPVGPSTSGDTISASIDFSGFLTAPILGCPTLSNDLTPPAPKAPKNGAIVYKPPKLTWKGNRGALGFHVEVDNDPDFSSPEQAADVLKSPLPVSSLPFGIYYWHVATRDWFGPGAYSAPFSFEVTLNKRPKKDATLKNGVVKFNWQKVKGKSNLLEVYADSALTTLAFAQQPLSKPNYSTKASPLTTGDYYWRVSIDGGNTWTPAWHFHVN